MPNGGATQYALSPHVQLRNGGAGTQSRGQCTQRHAGQGDSPVHAQHPHVRRVEARGFPAIGGSQAWKRKQDKLFTGTIIA